MLTLMQLWPVEMRRLSMKMRRLSDDGMTNAEVGERLLTVNKKAMLRWMECHQRLGSSSMGRIVHWQQRGCRVFKLDGAMDAILARAEIGHTKPSARRWIADGYSTDWTAVNDASIAARSSSVRAGWELRQALDLAGDKDGCVVFSIAPIGSEDGFVLNGNIGAGEHHFRTQAITLHWREVDARGCWEVGFTIEGIGMRPARMMDPPDVKTFVFDCIVGEYGEITQLSPPNETSFSIMGEPMTNPADWPDVPTTICHEFAWQIAATAMAGLLGEFVEYYQPRRRTKKGRSRRTGSISEYRTNVCELSADRWRRRIRKPTPGSRPSQKPMPPGHIPTPYNGPGYHVGHFHRHHWVKEANVLPGEEWLDIRDGQSGMLVKVYRRCNDSGYTIGELTETITEVRSV